MQEGGFIAVDWGTTNRRAYRIDAAGMVIRTERDGCGILSVPADGYKASLATLRDRLGGGPVVLAGMIGSNRGWVDAGYVACPATLEALAAAAVHPADGVTIVPGVCRSQDGRGDIMRGEELQLLGAVAAGLVPADALLCQPGTHAKWARMRGSAIEDFATSMTGEVYAILKDHSLLSGQMTGPAADGPAFRAGVAEAGRSDLLHALFGVRADVVLGLRASADSAAFVSGLLIGSDCAARLHDNAGRGTVHILADPGLGGLYAAAVETLGGTAQIVDSHAAFVAGITAFWELIQ